ncbi:MAG: methyltransferase domain-containing protein [Candidatus Lokiarchaeota archaeon]|nr:methyltransferase domain-containing protein [Candidatus Lokiarchaeota archaeon]
MQNSKIKKNPWESYQSNIFLMLIMYGTVFLSNFILDLFASRFGGPSYVGTVNLTRKWAVILATVLELGIVSTLPKFIAEKRKGNYYQISFFILILESVCVLIMGILTFLFFSNFLLIYIQFGLIAASSVILHGLFYSISRGMINIRNLFLIQIGFSGSRLISFIIFTLFDIQLFYNILISFSLIPILSILILFPIIKVHNKSDSKSNSLSKKLGFYDFFKFNLPIYISSIVAIISVELDAIIMGFFFKSTEIGLYLVAISLVGILNIVSNSVNVILLPKIAKFSHNKSKVISYIGQSVKFFLLIYIPILFVFFFYPKIVVNLLYGSGYSEVTFLTIRVLIISAFFNQISAILIESMIALDRPRYKLIGYITLMFLKLSLFFIFIPFFDIVGISWSVFSSQILQFIIIFILFKKSLRKRYNNDKFQINPRENKFWVIITIFCAIYFGLGLLINDILIQIFYIMVGLVIIFLTYSYTGYLHFISINLRFFKVKKTKKKRNIILSLRIRKIMFKTAKKSSIILDDGCGTSKITFNLARIHNIVGIEPNLNNLMEIKNKPNNKTAYFLQSVGEALPFKNNRFDFVVSQMVLEHCHSTIKYLQESFRILKNSNFLYISVPNWLFPLEPHSKIPLITYLPIRHYLSKNFLVNNFFSYSKICRILRSCNYSVKDINLFILKHNLINANRILLKFIAKNYKLIVKLYPILKYVFPSWAFLVKKSLK